MGYELAYILFPYAQKIHEDLTVLLKAYLDPFRYLGRRLTHVSAQQNQLNENLTRLKNGDKQSFNFVYELYVDSLHSFVLRLVKSQSLADDVVQEVFIKIWEKRDYIDPSKSFQAYLFKIAKNLVLNILIRYNREDHIMNEIMAAAKQHVNKTEEEIYFRETAHLIEEGVAKLPPQQKKIFELCKTQGLTYVQVSEKLNLSSHTINSQMVTLLRFLKHYLVSKESPKNTNTLPR